MFGATTPNNIFLFDTLPFFFPSPLPSRSKPRMLTHHRPRLPVDAGTPTVGETGDPGSTGFEFGLQGAFVSYASSIGLCTRPFPLAGDCVPGTAADEPTPVANFCSASGSSIRGPAVAAAAAADVIAGVAEGPLPLPPPLVPLLLLPADTNLRQSGT